MRNMVDYVEQMLLPVEEQPFNAVDSLVLSQFCQIWLNEATPDVCTDDGVKMTDLFRAGEPLKAASLLPEAQEMEEKMRSAAGFYGAPEDV